MKKNQVKHTFRTKRKLKSRELQKKQMTSKGKCVSCGAEIRDRQQKVCCFNCLRTFHRTCVPGFSQEDYRLRIKAETLNTWMCQECFGPVKELAEMSVDRSIIEIEDDEDSESQTMKLAEMSVDRSIIDIEDNENSESQTMINPQAPRGPMTFCSIKPTKLTLRWERSPSDRGADGIYHISFTDTSTGNEDVTASLTNPITMYRVTNLRPGTEYIVSMMYENSHGKSDPITSIVTTEHEKPQAPRGPMTFCRIKSTTLTLRCERSPSDHGADGIYHISFTDTSTGNEDVTASLTNPITMYRVTNLRPGTEYIVSMMYENSHGKSDPITSIVTTEHEKPQAPRGPMTFCSIKITTLTLRWERSPSDHGVDSIYHITFTDMSTGNEEVTASLTNPITMYRVTNLRPGTNYKVSMTYENSHGKSDPITSIVSTEHAKPCGPIGPLRFSVVKSTSFICIWGTSPDDTNSTSNNQYRVSVINNLTKEEEQSVVLSKLSCMYEVTDVSPNTEYTISIVFENSHGRSDPISNTTKTESKKTISYDMKDIPMYEVIDEVIKTRPLDTYTISEHFELDENVFGDKRTDKEHETRVQIRFCHKEKNCTQKTKFTGFPFKISINGKTTDPDGIVDLRFKKTNLWSKPVDLTNKCRPKPSSNDLFLMVDAQDMEGREKLRLIKDICVSLRLVKVIPVEELCEKLMTINYQTPDITRTLIKTKFSGDVDCDIATTSVHASLRCPIGKIKLKYPCRGRMCKHVQCEDALTIMSLNRDKPEFKCNTCSQPCSYYDLVIDGLFLEILKTVPDSVEEVEFREDGSWTYKGDKSMESDKENDIPIFELNLSNAFETIDLTETDDESTPRKEPVGNFFNKIGRQPLKLNTVILNTANSQNSRPQFGKNYQNSENLSCHRNNRNGSKSRARNRPPWNRNFRNRHQDHCSGRFFQSGNRLANSQNDWITSRNSAAYSSSYNNNAYYNQPSSHIPTSTFRYARQIQSTIFDAVNRITNWT